jgi:hypothetical protein
LVQGSNKHILYGQSVLILTDLVLFVAVFSDQCIKNEILVLVFYWNLVRVSRFLKCFTHAALSNCVLIHGINKLIQCSRINVLMRNNPHVHPRIF